MIGEHQVAIFDAAGMKVIYTLKFSKLEEAVARCLEILAKDGWKAADVLPDPDACSLEEYIAAINTQPDFLARNPEPGCWIGQLAEADYYRTLGISTARELDDRRFWDTWSDAYNAATGIRPRHTPFTREQAERELDSLFAMAEQQARWEAECELEAKAA